MSVWVGGVNFLHFPRFIPRGELHFCVVKMEDFKNGG